MMTKRLFIYGVGSYAEYAAYVFKNDTDYEVEGFCIERSFLEGAREKNEIKEAVAFENIIEKFKKDEYFLFIAIGNNSIRERIFKKTHKKSIKFASYISSTATIWSNIIVGDNCFIGEGCVIQPFVRIGNNSILFISSIGHHSEIGEHCLVSASTLGGNVRIGSFTYLGMNSAVMQNVEVGQKNVVGMGCSIHQNTSPGSVFTSKGTQMRNLSFEDVETKFLR